MSNVAVLGAGSWGTALALSLAAKEHEVRIWDINQEHLAELEEYRENRRYLPGPVFPASLTVKKTVEETVEGAEIVLFSAPAQHFRSALQSAKPFLKPGMVLVNVAKGIEQKTLKLLSEIAEEYVPEYPYVVLSGPSHAEEVGRNMPTTIVAASKDMDAAEKVQDTFMSERLRIYTNHDVVGVELGGALKNIIALGIGVIDGMGFGDNAKAAVMARGLTEMTRLGVKMGAHPTTFSGLTGVGDLIVTCTSLHSRNRRCGVLIGQGMDPAKAIAEVGMVVEGIYTAEAAYELATRLGVEMPITEQIYKVVREGADARQSLVTLMTRQKKHETEEFY
ncbi:MAG: NAD(P)H-dependent glycerol-3-phosphate dehydrogenase [Firmicutes bacterium]|nr:NAD(P)H-dependent glycerol-3-phosphate dehydrogenase [Bacillota bacterium]